MDEKLTTTGCTGRCSCCSTGSLVEKQGGPRGWPLVGMSLLAFVLPFVIALGAAAFFANRSAQQTAAVAGALVVALVVPPLLLQRFFKTHGDCS